MDIIHIFPPKDGAEYLEILLDHDIHAAAEIAAKQQGIDLSEYIVQLIKSAAPI